jgi:tetratricopeptide (TPR) repeat protein
MHGAIAQLEQCSREGEDMGIFQILAAALEALSLANAPDSDKARSGVATLERFSGVTEPFSPLAAYFLVFAYRRAGMANDAVRVATALLDRYPRGIIPKLVLASSHAANRDYLKAESLVQEVLALLPDDPWLSLGRAVLLRRANRMDEASAVLERVRVGPQQVRLKTLFDMENRLSRLRVAITPIR